MECKALGQLMTTARQGLNDQLRLVIRIWLKIRTEGVHKVERVGNMSKCWDYLVDHVKELIVANNMPSMDIFVNIYGKILINSFSLRSDR